MRNGLVFLDYALHFIHLAFISICIVGWMFEPTRIFHLWMVVLVGISWYGLGWFFEPGYCLLTDTQWRVKRKLGEQPHTDSYVKYMADKIPGLRVSQKITDSVTLYTYFGAVILALIVNFAL